MKRPKQIKRRDELLIKQRVTAAPGIIFMAFSLLFALVSLFITYHNKGTFFTWITLLFVVGCVLALITGIKLWKNRKQISCEVFADKEKIIIKIWKTEKREIQYKLINKLSLSVYADNSSLNFELEDGSEFQLDAASLGYLTDIFWHIGDHFNGKMFWEDEEVLRREHSLAE